MKSKYNRLSRLNQIMLAVATTGALMSNAYATTYTWTNTAATTTAWSTAANWDSNGVPVNDGTADVVFVDYAAGNALTMPVDPQNSNNPSDNWSIHSIDFNDVGGANVRSQRTISGKNTAATLSIGAGGIIIDDQSSPNFTVPVICTASQHWNINNWYPNNTGGMFIGGDGWGGTAASGGNITLNDGVMVTKTSTVASDSACKDLYFMRGTTTTIGSGAFTLDGGAFVFEGAGQFGRLGTNPLTITSNTHYRDTLSFVDSAGGTFSNNVNIVGSLAGGNTSLNLYCFNGTTANGGTMTFTGTWAGTVAGGWTNSTGFIASALNSILCTDDRYKIVYQGDWSGVTAATPGTWANGIMHLAQGTMVLNAPNAAGSGNNLSFFIGHNASQNTNQYCGLLATSGNGISNSGHIFIRPEENGANQHNPVSELGLSGTGSVTFACPIVLGNYGGTNNGYQMQRLKLTAPAGGTATFSGVISDWSVPSTYAYIPVKILAGGTVQLSGNNTYNGTTAVRGGTLLLGHNNALGIGTSAVSLGDTVTAPSGGDVAAATTIDLANVSGFTSDNVTNFGTITFSSAVSSVDGVSISPGNRILCKDWTYNPERTGVYTVVDSTHWTRAADLNTPAAFSAGLRVHVGYGTVNGGQNFYLYEGLIVRQYQSPAMNDGSGNATSAKFVFNQDAPSNTNVAILTNGAYTISRNIDVTNNLSSGQSILGGNSAVTSTFSGTVILAKNLAVQAASSGTVTFSGDITGGYGVTAQGSGLVKFSTAKSYTGTTSVSAGTLEVDNTIASSGVSVGTGGTLQGTGTVTNTLSVAGTGVVSPGLVAVGALHAGNTTISGHLAANVDDLSANELISTGTINLTGGTIDVTVGGGGFTQPYYVIAAASSITGTPSVTAGYTLTNTGTQLQLSLTPTNTFSNWMNTNYPSITGSDALPGANPSHDGINNLVKYALDLNPTVSAQPAGTHTGSSLTFTKGTMAKADSNLAYTIEESTDLVTWGAPTLGSVSYGDTITYTYPSGHAKVFARLKVVQTP